MLKGGAYPQPLPKGKGVGFNGYKVLPSREGFRIGLHLLVHQVKDIAVEGEEAFGRREFLGGAGDITLPVAGVEFSEHWVVEH